MYNNFLRRRGFKSKAKSDPVTEAFTQDHGFHRSRLRSSIHAIGKNQGGTTVNEGEFRCDKDVRPDRWQRGRCISI